MAGWNWKGRKAFILILFVIAAGAAAVYFFGIRGAAKEEKKNQASGKAPDRIYPVKRGDMVIGIMLRGSVNAKVKHKLALEAPFSTKLVKVVDENAKVKKGDVVAEFETTELLLKVEDYKLTIEQTKKDLAIALEEREVLKSTNSEDMRTARDKVTQCLDDYNRYVRLEGPRDKDSQTLAVDDAERALAEAQTAYDTAKESYDSTIFSDSEAEAKAKAEVEKAQKNVTSAETKLNSALLVHFLLPIFQIPNLLLYLC